MTFRDAVQSTPALASGFRPGLQALKGTDGSLVRCAAPRNLTGSVDLDSTLKSSLPNASRWDYGVRFRGADGSETATWVEIHPASSQHVREVIAKLHWLRGWLEANAPALRSMTADCHWIATGSINFTAGSTEARLLAKNRLRGPTKVLHLR